MPAAVSPDELKEAFKRLDRDGDGHISRSLFYVLLRKLDPSLRDDQCRCIFTATDTDKDDVISFDELVDYLFQEYSGHVTVNYYTYAEKFPIRDGQLRLADVDELYCLSEVMPGCTISISRKEFGYGEEHTYMLESPPGIVTGLKPGDTCWCYVQEASQTETNSVYCALERVPSGSYGTSIAFTAPALTEEQKLECIRQCDENVAKADFSDIRAWPGSGCEIPDPVDRGITLEQLRAVLAHARRRCEAEGWIMGGRNRGQLVQTDSVNLYDLCAYTIVPATKERCCSLVELVADEPQLTLWLVSHWWGEPVLDFITCLSQHAEDHVLSSTDSPYWVCAYANNQHRLHECISDDPAKTVFKVVMDRADGVVSIVDKHAVCFSRVWCCYEIFDALEGGNYAKSSKYCIYTAAEHMQGMLSRNGQGAGVKSKRLAVGITSGLAPCDYDPGEKTARERHFPIKLIDKAMQVRVQDAQASIEGDRIHILNTICGAENLDGEPPSSHPRYRALDDKLGGYFAHCALRNAIEAGHSALREYINALRGIQLPIFQMDLAGCGKFTDEVAIFILQALNPASLNEFTVTRSSSLTSLPNRLLKFSQLERLNLAGCRRLNSLPPDLGKLPSLKVVDVRGCPELIIPTLPPGVEVLSGKLGTHDNTPLWTATLKDSMSRK
eukprot:TRINITY_DN11974_c0_g1_i1.p1 TRINITY_DN11974_c0_g1~~TRINITY_DN11974_c0_g1_i1.p1  ORF type:complete len:685 (-),score=89.45 TRINITY_DN11974_c0_g1_i1:144-2147(-)